MSDSVDFSHDPVPSNDGEQLLFPQYFETLVRLDCTGRPRTGLAEAWTVDQTRRVWTFVLLDGRFADGSPEAAPRVISSWRAREATIQELGIESVAMRDSNLLVVTLSQFAADSGPHLFANPELAISRAASTLAHDTDLRVIRSDGPPPALIHFRIEPNSDPRDALDRGADLVVTRDPALVDYVSNRAEFATFPLPWSRTYVLAEPGAGQGEVAGALSAASVRNSMAKDAVRADARAAEPPYWWSETTCPSISTRPSQNASPRVVYRKDDEVARSLAERTVALAPTGAGPRAVGLDAAEFATAVRGGRERAYIIALPRQSLAPCRDASMWPTGARLLPLIDTRAYAIVRKGGPPLTVDWDGTLRVMER